jgi:hypothetical protein
MAVKDVELEMVDEALAAGRITEEQAARMRDRIENGELRFPGGRGANEHGCAAGGRFVYATAEMLGIDESAVIDGLQAGKSLATIAGENGMGADEFKAALTVEVEEDLAAKVADGTLTQEQADRMLAKFNENIDRIINLAPEAGAAGRCRGPRPGGFAPDGAPPPEAEGTRL